MSTPHISAAVGDYAKLCLMPGDPLRATHIAHNYLENAREVTRVRGMLGYTGTYKGRRISVMGSGMGMPSIGIYSYELYTQYNVDTIIRVGSMGAYSEALTLNDVVVCEGSYSESSFARTMCKEAADILYADSELTDTLCACALVLGSPVTRGILHSSDVFYRHGDNNYWRALNKDKACLGVEMESFALFANANYTHKKAACIATVSDSFVHPSLLSSDEREKGFDKMIRIALECAIRVECDE